MGWWQPEEEPDINLSDEAFDETYDYLESLSKLYLKVLGRKPSLRELETLWAVALKSCDQPAFADGEDLTVTSVTVKTAKQKKHKCKVGDVFAISLAKNVFGFGRIINLNSGWNLVDIFAFASNRPLFTPRILASGNLLYPLPLDVDEAFDSGKFRIIHFDENFDAGYVDSLRFKMGGKGFYKLLKPNSDAPIGKLSDEEAAKISDLSYAALDADLALIKKTLKERKLI